MSKYFALLRHVAETLAIAAAGGAAFHAVGFPAGWLAGAMLFTGAAALAGRPMHVPLWLGRVFFIVLGTSLGTIATPETVRGMAVWPFSIVMLTCAVTCVSAATSFYLVRVHGWDRPAAVLAAIPGALSQVMAFAAEYGLDLRAIAIVQTMRVVILSVAIPAGLALFGLTASTTLPAGPVGVFDAPAEFALLIVLSAAAGLVSFRLGFAGGLIFGPLVVSGLLHATEVVQVAIPPVAANIAMVTLGAVVGARFTNTPFRLVAKYFIAGVGSFAVGIFAAMAFAFAAASLLSLKAGDVLVAFAPGAAEMMMILSLALHLDPVYVGAHHIARIVMISLSLPLVLRWAMRSGRAGRQTAAPGAADKPDSSGKHGGRQGGLDSG